MFNHSPWFWTPFSVLMHLLSIIRVWHGCCLIFFCSWRFFEFKVEEKERGKQTEAQWRHKYKFWCTESGNESFWDGELLNLCSRTKLLCCKALNTSDSLSSFWSQTKCMKWCLYKTQGHAILLVSTLLSAPTQQNKHSEFSVHSFIVVLGYCL